MLVTLVVAGGVVSAGLTAWSRRAPRPTPTDHARRRTIRELEEGRFLVRGRVVPYETSPSAIDGARCVFVLRASVSPEKLLLRDVEHELVVHRFRVEDGTGALEIDPRQVVVDAPWIQGEAGLAVEQRLVAGDEVEVIARFRPSASGRTPYRREDGLYEPTPDPSDPPRVIPYREAIDPRLVPRADAILARGAAAFVLGASALLSWLLG